MILLIDNYDSFTFNLVHFLGDVGGRCEVVRNDKLTVEQALARQPEAIVLSPGPCTPNEAGICLNLIAAAAGKVPILGVCLGHQAIGQAFGGQVVRAPVPMHGKVSQISHTGTDILEGVPSPFSATRYHSLIVDRDHLPDVLVPTAWTAGRAADGDAPPFAADLRRAVPPGEHRQRARPPHPGQFPGDRPRLQPARPCGLTLPVSNDLKPILARLATGATLSAQQAEAAFDIIMSGEATPAQIGGLLMAMRVRGETVEELTGAVRALRTRMTAIEAPAGAIDVCGTGGDNAGTLNVSSAVTFVVAGCGVPVAKHGNRALSSRTGGADVLGALGVNVDVPLERLPDVLRAAGCAFLFAPRHHPSMRHAGGPRAELGTRTLFNLLGPMANPARVRRQLTGVFSPDWARPMAETLRALGTEAAWIVHGAGLDELTVAGENHVTELRVGEVRSFTVTPEEAGLERAPVEAIRGGDSALNAASLLALLEGAPGAYRDTVVLNAAAALVVAGRAGDLRHGAALAASAIASGAALVALQTLRRETTLS